MPERSGMLLLIVLCLLPCSVTSFECSLSALTPEVSSCPSFCRNATSMFYQSLECTLKHNLTLHSLLNIGLLPFPVYIILDLAPLIVYFKFLYSSSLTLILHQDQDRAFCSFTIHCQQFWSPIFLGDFSQCRVQSTA